MNVGTDGFGVVVRDPADVVDDEHQSNATEGEIRPLWQVSYVLGDMCLVTYLVIGNNESSNQTGDDHDPVHENGVENRRPWETGGQEEIQKQKRCRDEPGQG